ncbi:MAG: hypothetical protein J0L78_05905 [Planctomycetes bacterium]|nr:hypothetical protein [Planctomycetota bacterium]
MVKGIIGGLIGGAIGAAIWAAIVHFTHYEVGIVAWAIGALVGIGTAIFAGNSVSPVTGVAAAAIALGSIAGGKFAVVHMIAGKVKSDIHAQVEINDDRAMVSIADQLVEESEKAGKKIEWPKGMTRDEASEQADFPPAIWTDAKARWTAMSPADQDSYKKALAEHAHASLDHAIGQAESEAFFSSFTFFDILWAVLAIGSAFKLGSGDGGGGDD